MHLKAIYSSAANTFPPVQVRYTKEHQNVSDTPETYRVKRKHVFTEARRIKQHGMCRKVKDRIKLTRSFCEIITNYERFFFF